MAELRTAARGLHIQATSQLVAREGERRKADYRGYLLELLKGLKLSVVGEDGAAAHGHADNDPAPGLSQRCASDSGG